MQDNRASANPPLGDVIDKILAETLRAPLRGEYGGEIQRTVNAVVLNELMSLAANERASNQVRAIAEYRLEALRNWLQQQINLAPDENQKAFLLYAANQIKRFQEDPEKMNLTKPNDPADGQPIGTDWWTMLDEGWCDWR